MRRSLATILSLPLDDPHTSVARNMWTINTHILTTAVWLLFELIFSRDAGASSMADGQETEIRDLAAKASIFLQQNQSVGSRIAKRGVSLINALLEIERGDERQFNLNDIIAHVAGSDHHHHHHHHQATQATQGNVVSGDEPCAQVEGGDGARSIVDWLSRDAATWEDILDMLDSASQ